MNGQVDPLQQLAAAARHADSILPPVPLRLAFSRSDALSFGFWAGIGMAGASLLVGLVAGFIVGFLSVFGVRSPWPFH